MPQTDKSTVPLRLAVRYFNRAKRRVPPGSVIEQGRSSALGAAEGMLALDKTLDSVVRSWRTPAI